MIFKLRKRGENQRCGREDVKDILNRLLDGTYIVTIEKASPVRTLSQNARLWGYIYPQLLHYIKDAGGESFRSVYDLHFYYKNLRETGSFIDPLTGQAVSLPASTRDMTTEQLSLYMDVLENVAAIIYNAKIIYDNE